MKYLIRIVVLLLMLALMAWIAIQVNPELRSYVPFDLPF